jgi:hypothetical protein
MDKYSALDILDIEFYNSNSPECKYRTACNFNTQKHLGVEILFIKFSFLSLITNQVERCNYRVDTVLRYLNDGTWIETEGSIINKRITNFLDE